MHHRDIFSIFFNIKVCCLFSLESPHRGDSNDNTQYTIFNIKNENHPKLSQIYSYGIFPRDSKTSSKQPRYTCHQCSSHRSSTVVFLFELKCYISDSVKNWYVQKEIRLSCLSVQRGCFIHPATWGSPVS